MLPRGDLRCGMMRRYIRVATSGRKGVRQLSVTAGHLRPVACPCGGLTHACGPLRMSESKSLSAVDRERAHSMTSLSRCQPATSSRGVQAVTWMGGAA